MRAAVLAFASLAILPLAACATSTPQTQWGRQARQQCDRQIDTHTRGECYRRVEEAEREGRTPEQTPAQ